MALMIWGLKKRNSGLFLPVFYPDCRVGRIRSSGKFGAILVFYNIKKIPYFQAPLAEKIRNMKNKQKANTEQQKVKFYIFSRYINKKLVTNRQQVSKMFPRNRPLT